MKAVMMAGGKGSRLRPLTCTVPKPLARLCGKPMMAYGMDWLIRNGCDDIRITLGYRSEDIRMAFQEERYQTANLRFYTESTPLGTAGSVKQAAGDITEDFFVVSGDALCDFDLKKAMAFHKNSGAVVTLVTTRVEDPREFGLVRNTADGRLIGFAEKPGWKNVTTDCANTGIYILSPHILKHVPEGKPFDFATDLFPLLLRLAQPVSVYRADGYWCDVGNLTAYRTCQRDLLCHRVNVENFPFHKEFAGFPPIGHDYRLIPPVYIGHHVRLGKGCIIGPNTVIDDGCAVGNNTKIQDSVILPGSSIGSETHLREVVVGRDSIIGNGASLFEESALGDGASVGDGAELMPGVCLWPGKQAAAGETVRENRMEGKPAAPHITGNGFEGTLCEGLTPDFCARLGMALGSCREHGRIGIGFGTGNANRAIYFGLLCGLASTGVHIWNFGRLQKAQIQFAAAFCGLSACVYAGGTDRSCISVFGPEGIPSFRGLERQLEQLLHTGGNVRCPAEDVHDIADMHGLRLLYQQELYRMAPGGLERLTARVHCRDREGERLLEDAFVRLGGHLGEGANFTVDEAGITVTAVDEQGNSHSYEELYCLCCQWLLQRGNDIAVPFEAPRELDAFAEEAGKKCLRYYHLDAYNEPEVLQLAKKQYWLRDGMMMTLQILHRMGEEGKSLAELLRELPPLAVTEKQVPLKENPSRSMQKLSSIGQVEKQGVSIKTEEGFVRIWPENSGKALRVMAEAKSAEIADEICGNALSKITNLLDSHT